MRILAPAVVALAAAVLLSRAFASAPLMPAGNGHLLVPVLVNGKGPVPAVLDTGADESGVYAWFAKEAHLKPGPLKDVGGMTGSVVTPSYRIDSLTLDGRTIRHIKADSYPNRHDNEKEALVVGNDFMDGTVTVFDFPCQRVEIWPKPANMNQLLSSLAQHMHGGPVVDGTQLTFPITVGSAKGTAVLDTGNRYTKLNTQFARAAHIDPQAAAFADGEIIYGANSKGMASRVGPIGTVRIGDMAITNAKAEVIDVPILPSFGLNGPAMIFGLDLMRDIRLVYDHQAKQFWFDRSRCPAKPS